MLSTQWNRLLCVICTAIVFSLSGCSEFKQWMHNDHHMVGPDYCLPAPGIADHWIDFNNPRIISQNQYVDEGAWWRSLNDPVLDQLVFASYQQNLSLQAAGRRVLEARAQRAIAAGLLFPQFQEAFGSYNHIQLSRQSLADADLAVRSLDLWSTGFNVGWEIDLWGKFRRNLESADANLEATIADYDDVLLCLVAETAATYVEVREYEQRLTYVRANVEAQQGSLRIAESRFRNGAVSELDVTLAKTQLAQTEALIPFYEKGLRLANNRLCFLLGTPPRDLRPEMGPAPIPTPPSEVVVGIPAELLRRRPDIREAERRVAEQSARIGVAVADLFPAFTINGAINWQANKFSDVFSSAANAGFINPTFNWNILNYGRLRNNIRAQDAKFQELAILLQETVLKANTEAEDAIVSFLKAQEEVRSLQEAVEASERSQELVVKRYREGDVGIGLVFITQGVLVVQQDQLADAQSELALSLIRIYKALGGGWQIRCGGVVPQVPALEGWPAPGELPAPSPPTAAPAEAPKVAAERSSAIDNQSTWFW